MNANELLTKQDLFNLEVKLLKKIEGLFFSAKSLESGGQIPLLRSRDVRKMLGNISEGKLTAMRNRRLFPYLNVNGTFLYNREDISNFLKSKTISPKL